jgi:hypothetical protein
MCERAAPFSSPEDIFPLENIRTRVDLKFSEDILRNLIDELERQSDEKDASKIFICDNSPQFKKIGGVIFENAIVILPT